MAYDFDTIAQAYDRMNHLLTLGLDRCWRKRAVRGLHGNVLDVACGTGDMVLELAKQGCTVTGVDISEEMLEIAKQKTSSASTSPKLGEVDARRADGGVCLQLANAEHMPFEDNTFDVVTCAFGVRNFVNLEQGLSEMLRVLKPGGTMVILELAPPDNKLIRPFYNRYTKHIIPWLGSRLAGSREAYTYLPRSIERFPKGNDFLNIVRHSSLITYHSSHSKLTFGICRMYVINKEVDG